jgi:hypothetical protein
MKRRWFTIALLALAGLARTAAAQDTRATHLEFTCLFGSLHSHSVLSPDFQPRPPDMDLFRALVAGSSPERFEIPDGPVAAWQRAAVTGQLDFLALSEHMMDRIRRT